jgi:predicted RNase H-like HicB family nuclease
MVYGIGVAVKSSADWTWLQNPLSKGVRDSFQLLALSFWLVLCALGCIGSERHTGTIVHRSGVIICKWREDWPGYRGVAPIAGDGQRNIRQYSQTGRVEMKEYAAVFEKTSNGWSAYAPDLPGLGVAAATFAETEQLLREGIELHIEGMREEGLPIPEPVAQVMRMAIPA